MVAVSKAITTDRKASAAEVRAHAESLRRIAQEVGVTDPRLRDDGTVVVHSEHPGYRDAVALSQRLSDLVGCYVHVITDDVPGAVDALPV
jgi:predicted NBD/HSP70 family sugar kinase